MTAMPSSMARPNLWPSISHLYPLRDPPEQTLSAMCAIFYSQHDGGQCNRLGECSRATYLHNSRLSLEPYLEHYREITFLYTSENWQSPGSALTNHDDLHKLLKLLKQYPHRPKSELIADCFGTDDHGSKLDVTSRNRAFDLALSILAMVPFAKKNLFHQQYQMLAPEIWRGNQSAHFVLRKAVTPGHKLSTSEVCSISCTVSAMRIKKRGFEMEGTSDLRQHLNCDTIAKRIYVFRYPGFLKAHLDSCSRSESEDLSVYHPYLESD